MSARICCLDLDTFFVSVERLFDPTLIGRPVGVGGARGSRGVVTAASYEVRAFGVRSGMSMRDASRLAPKDAVFLPTRHGVYGEYSKRVRAMLERFSPEVRAASIDEFYMDFSGCERLYQRSADETGDTSIERAVRDMCEAIRSDTGLPASAGIGGTRIIAKIASGRAKPAGVLLVPVGAERDFLFPLPVRKFPGIGPKAEARMVADGIHTLGELVRLPSGLLRARYARVLAVVERECAGVSSNTPLGAERPAFREHDPSGLRVGSISNERTFFDTLGGDQRSLEQLLRLCERVCFRARKRGVRARTLTLKLRTSDFHTVTRSRSVEPTWDEASVMATLTELFHAARERPLPIRLLGVQLSNLVAEGDPVQLALPFERPRPVGHAMDKVRKKYGYDSVHLGGATRKRGGKVSRPG